MAHALFRTYTGLLALILVLAACSDHIDPPDGQRVRLKQNTLAYMSGEVFYRLDFQYNALNQVSGVTYNFVFRGSTTGDTLRRDQVTFTYDTQNRLVRYDYRIDNHLYCCIPPTDFGSRTTITYAAGGRTATVEEAKANSDFTTFQPVSKRQIEFGPNQEVLKEIDLMLNGEPQSTTTYQYQNGNVSEMLFVTTQVNSRTTYAYDNAPNPYYQLSGSAVFNPVFNTNRRNNLVREVTVGQFHQPDGSVLTNTTTSDYLNTYDGRGLLTKSVITTTPPTRGGSFSPNTQYFTYETY